MPSFRDQPLLPQMSPFSLNALTLLQCTSIYWQWLKSVHQRNEWFFPSVSVWRSSFHSFLCACKPAGIKRLSERFQNCHIYVWTKLIRMVCFAWRGKQHRSLVGEDFCWWGYGKIFTMNMKEKEEKDDAGLFLQTLGGVLPIWVIFDRGAGC